jgi:hypothetical protein
VAQRLIAAGAITAMRVAARGRTRTQFQGFSVYEIALHHQQSLRARFAEARSVGGITGNGYE